MEREKRKFKLTPQEFVEILIEGPKEPPHLTDTDHITDGEACQYATDTLSEEWVGRVERHMASCPPCMIDMIWLVARSEEWLGNQTKERLFRLLDKALDWYQKDDEEHSHPHVD